MLKVCITFDYELFLGRNNAPYQEILFSPTERIVKMLREQEVSGTFFADVCSVEAHRRLGDEKYCDDFRAQLQLMTQMGQDVQLHLHTNWFTAEKVEDQIIPGKEGYRIHSFGFGADGKAPEIIRQGKDYLTAVCGAVKPDYRCVAFRAGGFSVQPEKELFEALVQQGIVIDSSVVPHMRADTLNSYDFTDVPKRLNWWVDPALGLSEAVRPGPNTLLEIPIATARPRLLQAAGKPKSELSLPSHKPLGEYVKGGQPPKKKNALARQYHRLFDYRYVSLDTRYYLRVMEDLAYIYSKYRLDRSDGYICLICHPKLADEARIENIKKLTQEIKKQPQRYRFADFTEICREAFPGRKELGK